jgi:hypothetical protein
VRTELSKENGMLNPSQEMIQEVVNAAEVSSHDFSVHTVIEVLMELDYSDERLIEIVHAMELMDR